MVVSHAALSQAGRMPDESGLVGLIGCGLNENLFACCISIWSDSEAPGRSRSLEGIEGPAQKVFLEGTLVSKASIAARRMEKTMGDSI